MVESDPRLRNAAKAIIIEDGRLLATANRDRNGVYYLLPGGGQEGGENLHETIVRECIEEIGAQVEVGELRFVREYIGRNHEFAEDDGDAHQIEFIFTCCLLTRPSHEAATVPDTWQIGLEWLPLDGIEEFVLYPQTLKRHLASLGDYESVTDAAPVYLGDIN